jgi:hypothetical protein
MCHYFINLYNLFLLYLYFSISFKIVSCDNIDTEFPIIFTPNKSEFAPKLNEQNFSSYFGYSMGVSQEGDKN